MSNRSGSVIVTFPVLGLLGILFVALKLTGAITWSWWWVTCPFWFPSAVILVIGLLATVVLGLIHLIKACRPKRYLRRV